MSSLTGRTIAHYRILEKLGEGGMGVIYKAEDLKLTRVVALKFLPHGLETHEPERTRFLQEARAAAILNHPNICTIYDIQEHEGQQFIVMEYVEGETLREMVPVRRLQDAIGYATQIAEALQEAHSQGIVHRDIKAENIMVNSKDQVKVMDFGLAKLKGSLKITKTGAKVGTIAYMAPEQIRGEKVDARSDIFSFGIVLYEMLAGRLPFRGDNEAAMVYSIMDEDPQPLQKFLPDAPSELMHILNRALEKDREERYQTIHEMVIDLRRLKKESARVLRQPQGVPPATRPPQPEPLTGRRKIWGRPLWWGVAAGLVLCIVALLLFLPRRPSARLNLNRTSATVKVPFREISYPSLSRDGNWAAFAAKDESGRFHVYWMNLTLDRLSRVTEEGYAFVEAVDLSPDASRMAYDCREVPNGICKVKVVASQGGESRTVADTGYAPKWSPDGQTIGYLRAPPEPRSGYPSNSGNFEIWSVKPDGSDNHVVLTDSLHVFSGRVSFCWSPDGESIAWVRNLSSTRGEVMTRALATGREQQLTSDKQAVDEVIWATNNQILFVSDRSGTPNLWSIPAGGGEAIPITEGSNPVIGGRISADNKTLLYIQRETLTHLWISSFDGSNLRQVTSDYSRVVNASFSPDGNHIAYVRSEVEFWFSAAAHLFVVDREGKNQAQLTYGSEAVLHIRWSPDGMWIAFCSRGIGEPGDSSRVYLIQPREQGFPRLLCRSSTFAWVDSGEVAAYDGMKTLLYPIDGGAGGRIYSDSTFAIPIQHKRRLLFNDFREGKEGWWIVSLDALGRPTGVPKKILPSGTPMGAPGDWRFLICTDAGGEIWRVWTATGKRERIGLASPGAVLHDVSVDGKEILWSRPENQSKLVLVNNIYE